MAANSSLIVSSLNFDGIRSNLRNFIASKPDFKDFDFNDSAIGTLLDLLAYNTYYISFYNNMTAAEAFIDSAQFYDSVVSKAKLLSYIPRSARGASANVKIAFTTAQANSSRPTLTIPKGTKFRAVINGSSYIYSTSKSYTLQANSSNKFAGDIEIIEGVPLTQRYIYTSSNGNFVLPNKNIDTRSITVTVTSSGNTQTYVQVDDILSINSSSQIYYLEADKNQKYKVIFGDGVLGKKPALNSTVAISYRACNGEKGNGANNFSAVASIAGEVNFTIRVNERASGGSEIEDIESIRFNAPRSFETQNRAVIAEDYKRIILRDNPEIQAVNVWGGEENDPPIYGKIFACAKPKSGALISTSKKNSISNSLKKYSVQSLDLIMVDPTFLYIVPSVIVEFDSRKTTLSASEIGSLISNRIIAFESSNFSRFDSKFLLSRFLNYIDDSDSGIVGSTASILLQKKFRPSTFSSNTYKLQFAAELQSLENNSSVGRSTSDASFGYLTSSPFTYKQFTSYFVDDGFGLVKIYYDNVTIGRLGRTYLNTSAGSIDYKTGTVELRNFFPTEYVGEEMKINVRPVNPNIQASRNQLIFFSDSSVVVKDIATSTFIKITNIPTSGQTATLNESGLI